MKFLEIAGLGIRLFSIWIALSTFSFLVAARDISQSRPDSQTMLSVGLMIGLVGFGVAALLWLFPLAISRFLIPRINDTQPEIKLDEIWRVGCVLIGLLILSGSIPMILTYAFLLISGDLDFSALSPDIKYAGLNRIFQSIFAIVLITGNKTLYKFAIK